MTNENKNSNELVESDDDPTEELEVLAVEKDGTLHAATTFETDVTDTHQVLRFGDDDDGQALERLAAELDRVKADANALEQEVADREKTLARVASKLGQAEEDVQDRDQALADRDHKISALEARIETMESEARQLRIENSQRTEEEKDTKIEEELAAARLQIEQQAGQIAASKAENRQLLTQIERTEAYADKLRHELADITTDTQAVSAEQSSLSTELESAHARVTELTAELNEAQKAEKAATDALTEARADHDQEIKTLRFELGEAETSSAHYATTNERLLSDLMDARSFREELERMLNAQEEQNQARVEDFKKQVATLETAISAYRDNLDSKGDAIKDLLEELVNRGADSSKAAPPGNVAAFDTDRGSGDADNPPGPASRRPADDGIVRLLVGSIEDRELRFPLFKDKLTIGRTRENDIQLEAAYISRRHAVVCSDANATRIIDWDSKNGVYVNSRRVTEHFLHHGDIVSIGDAEFRYEERSKRDA